MAAAKKPKTDKVSDKKLTDVAKPGTTAPDATSRSIIVNNRPLLQDPMVVAGKETPGDAAQSESGTPAPSAAKVVIKPITVMSHNDDGSKTPLNTKPAAASEPKPEKPEEPAAPADEQAVAATPEPEAEAPAPEPAAKEVASEPSSDSEAAQAPAADTPAESEAEEKPANDQPAEESEVPPSAQTPEQIEAAAQEAEKQAAEHAAAIEKLTESKEYYLPIATAEQRKTKRFIALGAVLILVLGLAWLDVALDAGLVHLSGVKAVTHFFTS